MKRKRQVYMTVFWVALVLDVLILSWCMGEIMAGRADWSVYSSMFTAITTGILCIAGIVT